MSLASLQRGDLVTYRGKCYYIQPNGTSCYLYGAFDDLGFSSRALFQPALRSVRRATREELASTPQPPLVEPIRPPPFIPPPTMSLSPKEAKLLADHTLLKETKRRLKREEVNRRNEKDARDADASLPGLVIITIALTSINLLVSTLAAYNMVPAGLDLFWFLHIPWSVYAGMSVSFRIRLASYKTNKHWLWLAVGARLVTQVVAKLLLNVGSPPHPEPLQVIVSFEILLWMMMSMLACRCCGT